MIVWPLSILIPILTGEKTVLELRHDQSSFSQVFPWKALYNLYLLVSAWTCTCTAYTIHLSPRVGETHIASMYPCELQFCAQASANGIKKQNMLNGGGQILSPELSR